jgi:hypothetical protein
LLICLGYAPSSAFAVEHRHWMILIITADDSHHLPLSLARGWTGDSATLAAHGACPRDLYTLGLVTPLDRCNADIIHRRHCHQHHRPRSLIHAEWLAGRRRGDAVVGRQIGAQLRHHERLCDLSKIAMCPMVEPRHHFKIIRYKYHQKLRREKGIYPTRGFIASPEVGPGATVGTLQTGYLSAQDLKDQRHGARSVPDARRLWLHRVP